MWVEFGSVTGGKIGASWVSGGEGNREDGVVSVEERRKRWQSGGLCGVDDEEAERNNGAPADFPCSSGIVGRT